MKFILVTLILLLAGTLTAQNKNHNLGKEIPIDPNKVPVSILYILNEDDSTYTPCRLDSSGMLYVSTGSNIVKVTNKTTDDANLKAGRTVILNAEQFHYSATQIIVRDSVELSEKGVFQMIGSQISGQSYDYIKFFFTVNINDGKDIRLKISELSEYNSVEQYPLTNQKIVLNTNYIYKSKASERYFELSDDEDQNISLEVELNNTTAFVKLEASFGIDGGKNPSISLVQVRQGNK